MKQVADDDVDRHPRQVEEGIGTTADQEGLDAVEITAGLRGFDAERRIDGQEGHALEDSG